MMLCALIVKLVLLLSFLYFAEHCASPFAIESRQANVILYTCKMSCSNFVKFETV